VAWQTASSALRRLTLLASEDGGAVAGGREDNVGVVALLADLLEDVARGLLAVGDVLVGLRLHVGDKVDGERHGDAHREDGNQGEGDRRVGHHLVRLLA